MLTEKQKMDFENLFNFYSLQKSYDSELRAEWDAKMWAFRTAVSIFGYEFEINQIEENNGVEYFSFKLVKGENFYTNELRKLVEEIPNTSAYKRGIKKYTDELLDNLEEMAQSYKRLPKNENELKEWLLKGASNWEDYSYRGYSLKSNRQIAERLCTSSELKKKDGGRIAPSRYKTWFDEQSEALCYAYLRIKDKFRLLKKPQIDF